MSENYRQLFNRALELVKKGKLDNEDIVVLLAMTNSINFDSYNDIKNKRIMAITGIEKENIKLSIKCLLEQNLLLEDNYEGYMLNSNNVYNGTIDTSEYK